MTDPEGKTEPLSTGKIVFKNSLSLILASSLDTFLRFFALGHAGQVLGVADFGQNTFLLMTAFFFAGLGDFGLRILGNREIATHREQLSRYINNIFTLKLLLCLLSFGLMQLFVWMLGMSGPARLLALVYGLGLLNSHLVDWVWMGLEKMPLVGLTKVINGVLVFAGLYLFVRTPEHGFRMAWVQVGAEIIMFLLLLLPIYRRLGIRLTIDPPFAKNLLRQSYPLAISELMFRFYSYLPLLVLQVFRSDYEIGIFRAANLLPNFVGYLALIFSNALFPSLSRLYAESRDRFQRLAAAGAKLMVAAGIPIAIGGMFVARLVIMLVFDEAYSESIVVFQILIGAMAFIYPGVLLRETLPACHWQGSYALAMTLRTISGTILAVVLVLFLGVYGVTLALLIAEVLSAGVSFYYFRARVWKITFKEYLWKSLLAAGLMALTIWFLEPRWGIIAASVVGSLVYFGLFVVVLRGLTITEAKALRNILLRRNKAYDSV